MKFLIKSVSYLFIVILLLSTQRAVGQLSKQDIRAVNRMLLSADDQFSRGHYYYASVEYDAIARFDSSNAYVKYMLAESYRLQFDYNRAEIWYANTLESSTTNEFELTRYRLASMLKINGNYERAKLEFSEFISFYSTLENPDLSVLDDAILQYNGCHIALQWNLRKPKQEYGHKNAGKPINTAYLDYAPVIFGSDSMIVITSSRTGSKGEEMYGRYGDGFSDIYRFRLDEHGWKKVHDSKNNFSVLNTARNDGVGVLSGDGQKYYYTSCDEKTGGECAIYVSHYDGKNWGNPEKLNEHINPEGVWNSQPTLSGSGDTLFFVSKRAGGYGGNDIWFATKDQCAFDGECWGEAINLGPNVNTALNDMSPSFHTPTQSLFFASDGHEGFGGLDLFLATNVNDSIFNLGSPFNSSRDDYHLVIGNGNGYMTSNRVDEESHGKADIYSFKFISKYDVIYDFIPEKENVKSIENPLDTHSFSKLPKQDWIEYTTIDLGGRLTNEQGRAAIDVSIQLLDQDDQVIRSVKTDENGVWIFTNLPRDKRCKVVIPGDKMIFVDPEHKYLVDVIKKRESHDQIAKTLFENIYFDFDAFGLRPEAKRTLDMLIEFSEAHPAIQVELNGNTDAFGSDAYNIELGRQRSKMAYDYLISNGFPKRLLAFGGSGEKSPIASNKNEVGRQLNRRVEFYVLGALRPISEYKTYITEGPIALRKVASMFDMSVRELADANGLIQGQDRIGAYQPLRVRMGDKKEMVSIRSRKASEMNAYGFVSEAEATLLHAKAEEGGAKVTTIVQSSRDYRDQILQIQNAFNLRENWMVKAKDGEIIYVVQPLETLSVLGIRFNVSVEELKEINVLKTERLQIGQRLRIPNQEKDARLLKNKSDL